MGEVLQFPAGRGDQEGAGRRPAPSGPSGPAQGAEAPEERWTVPVIDSGEPAAVVPAAPETVPGPGDRRTRRASNVAMATLARHDASEGEVRGRLVARGLEDSEVEAELERLRGVGLLDDGAFAARLVESLRERKGLGDGAIRNALRTRMVPPAVVDAVLADRVEDEESLHDRLQTVADDRARRLTSLPYEVAERRLTAYLMRKGYGGSVVRSAARSALEAAGVR